MADDIRQLLSSIGVADFEYKEVAAIERWQSAAQRWPLIAQTNRVLLERLLVEPQRTPEPQRSIGRGFVVALVSLSGGAGRTTLAANVAATLGQNGRQVTAVDLDPQNSLGLHFGVDPSETFGWCSPALTQQQNALWLSRFRGGTAVLPFGRLTAPQISTLEATVSRDPTWVARRLESLVPPESELVVLDTPARPSPWVKAALSLADAVLVVIQPDATSYAALPATEALLDEYMPAPLGRRRARYLVNRLDAQRTLDRDVFASLRGMMPDRALPYAIHADEAVPESLARRKLVVQDSADSQVVAELSDLAEWIEAGSAAAHKVAQPLISVPLG